MKQIQAVSIWDNGTNQNAEILNAYAVNVTLNVSATFYYSLLSATKQTLATGNLKMSRDAYAEWANNDDYAWEWIAGQLDLVIVNDWVEPVVKKNLTVELNSIDSDLNQMLIKGA